MPAADRLTFGRVSTTYVVPRGTPAPDDVRRRGDVALREHLFAALGPALAKLLPRGDDTVWIIRRLDLDFPFALEQQSLAVLGETWAAELTRGLVRALRGDGNVARFPSRAAFLAQFVFDVAHGRDAGCWYYDCFESLRALPRSAVIREALVREPDQALAVLLELARAQRLSAVLGALHESGARAIYEAAFPAASQVLAPSPRMIETLLALCEKPSPADALRLAVALCVEGGDPADIRAHVDRVIELTSLLSMPEPWRLVEALVDGDLAAATRLCPFAIDTLQFFAGLGASRPDVLTSVAASITASSPSPSRDDAVLSRFAGLAMLLPDLWSAATPVAALKAATQSPHSTSELRARVAVECALGATEVLSDPVIELFRGIDEEVEDDRDAADLAREVLQRFASRLFGFAGSTPEYLYANFLEGTGSIRHRDDEVIVELPPVPLEVILHMAGMHERRFSVPWLPDKTIVLLLGGRR